PISTPGGSFGQSLTSMYIPVGGSAMAREWSWPMASTVTAHIKVPSSCLIGYSEPKKRSRRRTVNHGDAESRRRHGEDTQWMHVRRPAGTAGLRCDEGPLQN